MKYLIILYFLSCNTLINAQLQWTEEDRTYLIENLNRTTEILKEEIDGLTDEQWNFKEGPDKWSIAEVIEHLGIYEFKYYDQRYQIYLLPPEPELEKSTPPDSFYLDWINEDQPHSAVLSGRPLGLIEGSKNWDYFMIWRSRNLEKISNTTRDFRAHYGFRSKNRRWNIHQLYIILFAHCDRHLKQIKRIKAHQDFP